MGVRIVYSSLEHERFFHTMMENCSVNDSYHRALIYSLGICRETREHINDIYDFKTGLVNAECLHYGWQTGGSSRVVRLAFNLYCCCMPSVDDKNDGLEEAEHYAPDEIFSCCYAPYFWQAVKLRYPEYCGKEVS